MYHYFIDTQFLYCLIYQKITKQIELLNDKTILFFSSKISLNIFPPSLYDVNYDVRHFILLPVPLKSGVATKKQEFLQHYILAFGATIEVEGANLMALEINS